MCATKHGQPPYAGSTFSCCRVGARAWPGYAIAELLGTVPSSSLSPGGSFSRRCDAANHAYSTVACERYWEPDIRKRTGRICSRCSRGSKRQCGGASLKTRDLPIQNYWLPASNLYRENRHMRTWGRVPDRHYCEPRIDSAEVRSQRHAAVLTIHDEFFLLRSECPDIPHEAPAR